MTSSSYISQHCMCYQMRSAARTITRIYDEHLKQNNIKANQYTMLVAVNIMEQVSISNLAEELMMERTTLTRNLAPLEKQKLVVLSAGNGRTRYVSLTAKGKQLVEDTKPLWLKAQEKVKQVLGDSEILSLAKISKDISKLTEGTL